MKSSRVLVGVLTVVAALAVAARPAEATLLTPSSALQLEDWLGQGNLDFTSIYEKAADDDSADFHAAVDGEGPTFSLIEITFLLGSASVTQVIGGYNPQSWHSGGFYNLTTLDSDRTAFIYNLTTDTMQSQRLSSAPGNFGQYQTFNRADFGPTFGVGWDIYVNSSLTGGSALPRSYGDGINGIAPTSFTVGAIEVYTFDAAPVPDGGATMALLGMGLLGLGVARRYLGGL